MAVSLASKAAALQRELAPDLVVTDFTRYRYVDPAHPGTTGPVGFAREVLGIRAEGYDEREPGQPYLWAHQQEIALSVEGFQRTSVASCHAIGKDFTAGRIIVPWFLNAFEESKVITTGPTERQVKLLLWGEIKTAKLKAIKPLPGRDNLTDWFITAEHYAVGFKSKDGDPERFAGFHAKHLLYVVDEASGVEDNIFQSIEGGLSAGDARILMIGNPLRVGGQFHRSFHQERRLWNTVQIAADQTPNFRLQPDEGETMVAPYLINPKWAEEKREVWGEDSPLYQARVLGQFPTEGVNTLISLHYVMAAVEAESDSLMSPRTAKEMGVDVARYGNNECAFHIRQGKHHVASRAWGMKDLMTTAAFVKDAILEHEVVKCRVDVIGMGSGVFDRLQQYQNDGELPANVELIPVNVAQSPSDVPAGTTVSVRFKMLRDEMWWNLREKFRLAEITNLPNDDILIGQLTSITYSYETGKLVVEKKEQMTKRLGGDDVSNSPDRAEALMLAYWDDGPSIDDPGTVEFLLDDGMDSEYGYGRGLASNPF